MLRLLPLASLALAAGRHHYGHHRPSCSAGESTASIAVASTDPLALKISYGAEVVSNSAILVGSSNASASAVSLDGLTNSGGSISATLVSSQVAKISVNTTSSFVGARFSTVEDGRSYGVWSYPWFEHQLDNAGVDFQLKGLGFAEGINWINARAPFFFTDDGYGVYADTLEMGNYDFSTPGNVEFVFNTSSLVYYVIFPETPSDYKSLLTAYGEISSTISMPPDSGYGPTYWSDDFEQDFHGDVSNAQENYFDVVNHLYDYRIHATSTFADRPYGTGNSSFGNFDFDPEFYPTPVEFIANLSRSGFDFQVWAANRAFLDTELYNTSIANGWLFPGIDGEIYQGPALNLSIPEAYEYFKSRMSYFPSVGVKGYKIDRGEEGEMPVHEQNIQAALFDQLLYETMVERWGEGNFYNFGRNVVDRSRSVANIWNGDAHANFTGLAFSVTSGIRSGLMGFSTWGSDTGGYIRELDGQPTEELWARWMHFSTFSPVYELMLGTNHTPYYPPYTSDLVAVMKETSNLHHNLIPYIKSYTYQATQTGIPMMRALFLENPDDAAVYEITDEYFFGAEMLIAPIVNKGGNRSVYFPGDEKTKYLEYFNKTSVHSGGSSCDVQMDVHAIPAYVKAGSIIPRGDIYQGNNLWTEDWTPELSIELYPSYEVGYSEFEYYSGEEGAQMIKMMVDGIGRSVRVEYGPLGVNGTLTLFGKHGMQNATVQARGGSAMFEEVESLFD